MGGDPLAATRAVSTFFMLAVIVEGLVARSVGALPAAELPMQLLERVFPAVFVAMVAYFYAVLGPRIRQTTAGADTAKALGIYQLYIIVQHSVFGMGSVCGLLLVLLGAPMPYFYTLGGASLALMLSNRPDEIHFANFRP